MSDRKKMLAAECFVVAVARMLAAACFVVAATSRDLRLCLAFLVLGWGLTIWSGHLSGRRR
jgi:hypothetical protein